LRRNGGECTVLFVRGRRVLLVSGLVLLLSGCSPSTSNMTFDATPPPARTPYTGPLTTTTSSSPPPRSVAQPGAAGTVVHCSISPTGSTVRPGSEQPPDASPEGAVDKYVSTELPVRQLARERTDKDRVLFTTSYGGVARQAVIVRRADPSTDPAAHDSTGWYVDSYAYCDLADFPESITSAAGIEIWSDTRGVRQPTTRIQSTHGPEHCDLQNTTFLTIGRGTNAYVDHIPPDLRDNFKERPRRHVSVPRDAMDTGFSRSGDHLWLSADRTRAYIGTGTNAALWPREIHAFGCA
jgi:hypothetical protein